MLSGAMARLRALFRPASIDREIDEELDGHVLRDIAQRLADGASADDAERAARRCLGNLTLHHENAREAYGWRWADELRQDLRYAVRQIRRAPALSAVIVGLLAIGIGPNAAVIAYVDQLLEHPWPGVTDTEGLYRISFMYQRTDSAAGARTLEPVKLAPENFDTFRQRQHEFEAVARTVDKRAALDVDGVHSTVDVQLVTGEYFQVYRLDMAAGSAIPVLDDHTADPPHVVVISDHFWRALLGGSPGAIGKVVGARAEQVVWLFFRDGMRLAIAGFVVGVPLALAIMKVTVANELGTRVLAPSAVGAIVGILLMVAAVASWIPARRAAAVDPLIALRSE